MLGKPRAGPEPSSSGSEGKSQRPRARRACQARVWARPRAQRTCVSPCSRSPTLHTSHTRTLPPCLRGPGDMNTWWPMGVLIGGPCVHCKGGQNAPRPLGPGQRELALRQGAGQAEPRTPFLTHREVPCAGPRGAPGPRASAGNASKEGTPTGSEVAGPTGNHGSSSSGVGPGSLGEDPPPHRGVESGSHPHRVLPSPWRGASPGAALPRPSWDTPARLASPSGPAHRSTEPPALAGGTPHLCSVSLALAGQGGRLAAEGASPAELSRPGSWERP